MDSDNTEERMRRQAEACDDVERLRAQAGPLSAVWAGLRMEGTDIVVLLTEPERYEQQVRGVVEHPERLHVRQSHHTRSQLDEVHRQTIELIGQDNWKSHGPGVEQVTVTLHSNRTALAQQLPERFGDAIAITLGRHRYPLDPARVLEPSPMPDSTIDLPGLVCTIEPDHNTWPPGEDIQGQVHVSNNGDAPVMVSSQSVGVLLNDVGRLVGEWSGAMAFGLQTRTIAPGTQDTIRFTAGSDTNDPGLGAALPPGTYNLAIPLDIYDISPNGRPTRGSARTFLTKGVPIQLEVPQQ